eukprot:gnl/MRDRNA2_/MRDRNA2_49777_c0_seq1.p1 gnl/MRDRNA2_/MRDRNA2_49777_c0~~gnl/MRDRNA2_/MRDRNA2_49777_c0_seq1.p1  ORF type:complete len:139 (+),score=15.06 gnl/MRDRNA2_/MRDRNA2_49777_c0_seq1:110-526(+)
MGGWGHSDELFDAQCDGCECRMPCPHDAYTPMARNGQCSCSLDDNGFKCFNGNSHAPGCPSNDGLIELSMSFDVACEDCSCRYVGPYRVGQQIEVQTSSSSWSSGEVTSIGRGKIMVKPLLWKESYPFKPHELRFKTG